MYSSSLIGKSAVYFDNRHNTRTVGRISQVFFKDGETRAIFQEPPAKHWLTLTHMRHIFLGSSRTVPLHGLHILEDVIVPKRHLPPVLPSQNGRTHSRQKDDGIHIRYRQSEDLILYPAPLEQLKKGEIVVWNPDKSTNTSDSFVGEIQQTSVHIDVMDNTTFYAELLMLDGSQHLMGGPHHGRFSKDGTLKCRTWAPISEMQKIGMVIQNVTNNMDHGSDVEKGATSCTKPEDHPSSSNGDQNRRKEQIISTLMETNLDQDENVNNDNVAYFLENLTKARNRGDNTYKGIQGKSNSCYMDSSLFVLFSFTTIFDSIMLQQRPIGQETEISQNVMKALTNIVTKLRIDFYVPFSDISQLRDAMGQINEGYRTGSFMDAEELLLDLFDCLSCPDFFEFTNQATDRIHQIILPASNEAGGFSNDNIYAKEIALLFQDSLWYSEVKLANQRPNPALILKLPFCNGRPLFGCKIVVPNLTLDLGPLLENKCSFESMDLFAITCLKSSHYVCFVKCGNEKFSPWIYFDSSPVDMQPKVDVLENLSEDLAKIAQDPGMLRKHDSANTLEYREHIQLICGYCYMCFYK